MFCLLKGYGVNLKKNLRFVTYPKYRCGMQYHTYISNAVFASSQSNSDTLDLGLSLVFKHFDINKSFIATSYSLHNLFVALKDLNTYVGGFR